MAEVFVGVGSNIEPERHVVAALTQVAQRYGPLRLSPVYRSQAVGFEGDDFINLVLSFDTQAGPDELSEGLRSIEHECGRSRHSERFAPRVIDLDLLMVGDRVSEAGEQPVLPRAEILDYAFVLRPLAEMAPETRHPVAQCSFSELWHRRRAEIDKGDLVPVHLDLPQSLAMDVGFVG